jgi:hypothetical protein
MDKIRTKTRFKVIPMGRDGQRGFCGRKALNLQIFIIGYLQFVERKHLHATLCSTGYGASTVARKLARRLSVIGIATSLKNCSVKTSGSSQGDGSDL